MTVELYGCFFCRGGGPENGACTTCARPINIAELLLRHQFGDYRTLGLLGRGYYGWTLHVTDDLPQPFALKVVPEKRILMDGDFPVEARAIAQCGSHRNIAKLSKPF